jgi:hypothetical protein
LFARFNETNINIRRKSIVINPVIDSDDDSDFKLPSDDDDIDRINPFVRHKFKDYTVDLTRDDLEGMIVTIIILCGFNAQIHLAILPIIWCHNSHLHLAMKPHMLNKK